jgi:hypothetical protein
MLVFSTGKEENDCYFTAGTRREEERQGKGKKEMK